MTDLNVPAERPVSEPSPWLDIADELERIAKDCRDLVGEPAPCTFYLGVQPHTPTPLARAATESRPAAVAAVDAVAVALLGHPAKTERMLSGTFHHTTEGDRGPIHLDIYQQVADPDAVDPEEEIARLRAENERLRAAVTGPSPEQLAAVADKLSADQAAEVALEPSGLTRAADQSRGPLAGTTPVVTYFSFGHGQTDPDSGVKLLDHYVTVVAPTYDGCREAMFASRFGRAWSFDYLAGTARATEWIPRWTEHEVIVAPGVDAGEANWALGLAMRVLDERQPELQPWESAAPLADRIAESMEPIPDYDDPRDRTHGAEFEAYDAAEPPTCLGADMDCGRPLPCPDHRRIAPEAP